MASFSLSGVDANACGWGPTALPEQFLDKPYAPFLKSDRLGRAADFSQPASMQHQRSGRYRNEASGTNAEFQYKFDSMESDTFQLVDTIKVRSQVARRPWKNNRNFNQNRRFQPARGQTAVEKKPWINQPTSRKQQLFHNRRQYGRRLERTRIERKPSVRVQPEWELMQEFELNAMLKLQANVPEVEDLMECGHLQTYDDANDRLSTRNAPRLERIVNREFYYVTTTDDPVVENLACSGQAQVFATDAVLSLLMTAPRSIIPWDVVVRRVGNSLFFDKRDDGDFDLLTVSETAQDAPAAKDDDPDNLNSPQKLAEEATMINQNYSQQILRNGITKTFPNPNPFFDGEQAAENSAPAAFAYRYRKWQLTDNISMVARCELHGMVKKREEESYMTTYALNEWDSKMSGGIEWRQKIDSQRGAVFATELKNNSAKLSRWTAQTLLAGADVMNIGYVSRVNRTDRYSHTVLGSQFFKPVDFAQQIALNPNNMWGIIKMLVDLFMQHPEGKYILMRDPNKATLLVYKVSSNVVSDDEGEDDE